MKRIAIVQSSYIPWKGYFDIIAAVDEFVLYDDVQFTRRDWRNRNQIKTAEGRTWLTIPVEVKGRFSQTICQTRTASNAWRRDHWLTLRANYARSPFFAEYANRFEALYLAEADVMLSRINHHFISAVCDVLRIGTRLRWSMDYAVAGSATERLVRLCQAAGATHYLSGPSAKAYLQAGLFHDAGITLEFMNYEGYPVYPQLHGPFEHHVSVLDLLFNVGPDAGRYMKHLSHGRLTSHDTR